MNEPRRRFTTTNRQPLWHHVEHDDAGITAGIVGDMFGYSVMFGSALVLSGIGCAVLVIALGRGAGPSSLHEALSQKAGM